jgi:transcriptional regulator with XRE-family HTH domain
MITSNKVLRESTEHLGIGGRLRDARKQRGLTIDQLAQATGLTKGFLSQVERDLANTSVSSLLRICGALGIRVGELFDDEDGPVLVRADEAPAIQFGGEGADDRLLSARANRKLQVIHATVAPGGHSGERGYATPSDAQFVHVLRGEFELTLAGEPYRLRAGDSLTFSGREPRAWRNAGRGRAEVLWVITPSLF